MIRWRTKLFIGLEVFPLLHLLKNHKLALAPYVFCSFCFEYAIAASCMLALSALRITKFHLTLIMF